MKKPKFWKKNRKVYQEYKDKIHHWWVMEGGPWLDYFWPYAETRTVYYNLKNGIRNLIIWVPIIWQDRDWDHAYLFRMLEHKFSLMEKLFREHGHLVSADRNAHNIKICKNLCKRLHEGNYTNLYEKRNNPHSEWFSKKIKESFCKEPNENGFITIVNHYEPDEPDSRWILPAHKHEEYLANQDVDLLCKLIQKHVRGWWD